MDEAVSSKPGGGVSRMSVSACSEVLVFASSRGRSEHFRDLCVNGVDFLFFREDNRLDRRGIVEEECSTNCDVMV